MNNSETESSRSREQLLEQRLQLALREQAMFAHELHDGVIQHLVGAKLFLAAVDRPSEDSAVEIDRRSESLAAARGAMDQAIAETRRLIAKQPMLEGPVIPWGELEMLIEHTASRRLEACPIELKLALQLAPESGPDVGVPATIAHAIIRVLQESLSNVVRHSRATSVVVQLAVIDSRVMLSVTDDGVGILRDQHGQLQIPSPDDGHSFGIHGMVSRAKSFGGALDISDNASGGTKVQLSVPRHDPLL
jgi:signal transduction histidine kinase